MNLIVWLYQNKENRINYLEKALWRLKAVDKSPREIQDFAEETVKEAIKAGGTSPYNYDGEIILSVSPLEGDWDALRDFLGREPTEEEEILFENRYADLMQVHIDSYRDVD